MVFADIPGRTKKTEPIMLQQYVTFNPFRSIGIPSARYIKPEEMFGRLRELGTAERILFPRSWQVNALAYALKKKIFPSLATYHLGYDKIEMTRGFMALCPSMVPKTGFYLNTAVAFDTLADTFGLPFVCKEPRSSSGLGVFLIKTKEEFQLYAKDNPTLYVQEYLEMDRDLRVVIIGEEVVSTYWRVKSPGDFHNNISRGGRIERTNIPERVVWEVAGVAQALGIDYAGFDIAITNSGAFLLEFNVFFGTQGVQRSSSELGKIVHKHLQSDALDTLYKTGTLSCEPRSVSVPSEHCLEKAEINFWDRF